MFWQFILYDSLIRNFSVKNIWSSSFFSMKIQNMTKLRLMLLAGCSQTRQTMSEIAAGFRIPSAIKNVENNLECKI